ncbi:hypothetical protein PoB_000535400 [Plakobranchus ocellatus]|uniref:Uncharacterized protein n=1 Tax=Plakobranchus ocellatus TaxID=259542 RepID=A0AAV3Y9U6_9GAST|nr:hypothetical protein PoB_000535400 [Plakobranchus ocellatus]
MTISYKHYSQFAVLKCARIGEIETSEKKQVTRSLEIWESFSITTTLQCTLPEWSPSCWTNMSGQCWSMHVIPLILLHVTSGYFQRKKITCVVTEEDIIFATKTAIRLLDKDPCVTAFDS